MTLAAAYPKCAFHGYDISQKSLDAAARRQAAVFSRGSCVLELLSSGLKPYKMLHRALAANALSGHVVPGRRRRVWDT